MGEDPDMAPVPPGGDEPRRAVDVFVSYNSKDHVVVRELAGGLEKKGLDAFLDRWDLDPGVRWRPELERVLASCGAVLVLVGPNGVGEVQEREVDVALRRQDKDKEFPVIPVLLPGAEPPGGMLATLTWVDIRLVSAEEAVDDLVLAIRKNWGKDVSEARAKTNRRRYLVNLVLLMAVLLAAGTWYLRHLHERMEHLVFGGSVTLPTLVWLTFLYLRWGAQDEVKNFPRRLFGSANSTRGLGVGLVAALGLHVATSSVQIRKSTGSGAGDGARIEVRDAGGQSVWRSAALGVEKPVVSRLFWFRFGRPVEIGLDPALDRGTVRTRLGPGTRVVLRVPDGFPPRSAEMVRLLFGGGLDASLGDPGGEVNSKWHLLVIAGGATNRIEDVRKQAIGFAANAEDFRLAMSREAEPDRDRSFLDWAKARVRGSEDEIRIFVKSWRNVRAVTGLPLPRPIQDVRFQRLWDDSIEPEQLTSVVLDGTNGIQTLLIDQAPP